jgi:hypothetical protein
LYHKLLPSVVVPLDVLEPEVLVVGLLLVVLEVLVVVLLVVDTGAKVGSTR